MIFISKHDRINVRERGNVRCQLLDVNIWLDNREGITDIGVVNYVKQKSANKKGNDGLDYFASEQNSNAFFTEMLDKSGDALVVERIVCSDIAVII